MNTKTIAAEAKGEADRAAAAERAAQVQREQVERTRLDAEKKASDEAEADKNRAASTQVIATRDRLAAEEKRDTFAATDHGMAQAERDRLAASDPQPADAASIADRAERDRREKWGDSVRVTGLEREDRERAEAAHADEPRAKDPVILPMGEFAILALGFEGDHDKELGPMRAPGTGSVVSSDTNVVLATVSVKDGEAQLRLDAINPGEADVSYRFGDVALTIPVEIVNRIPKAVVVRDVSRQRAEPAA